MDREAGVAGNDVHGVKLGHVRLNNSPQHPLAASLAISQCGSQCFGLVFGVRVLCLVSAATPSSVVACGAFLADLIVHKKSNGLLRSVISFAAFINSTFSKGILYRLVKRRAGPSSPCESISLCQLDVPQDRCIILFWTNFLERMAPADATHD